VADLEVDLEIDSEIDSEMDSEMDSEIDSEMDSEMDSECVADSEMRGRGASRAGHSMVVQIGKKDWGGWAGVSAEVQDGGGGGDWTSLVEHAICYWTSMSCVTGQACHLLLDKHVMCYSLAGQVGPAPDDDPERARLLLRRGPAHGVGAPPIPRRPPRHLRRRRLPLPLRRLAGPRPHRIPHPPHPLPPRRAPRRGPHPPVARPVRRAPRTGRS
jgi:hypothetical protein